MKQLHILNEITFSGAEVMLKVAAPIFAQKGYEFHVLSTGAEVGLYTDTLRACGYVVHHIPFEKSPVYFVRLWRLLKKEKYDLIHINPERAFFWHSALSWLVGTPRIIRSVLDVFLFTGYLRVKRKYQRLVARKMFGVEYIAIGYSVGVIEKEYFQNPTILVKDWIDEEYFRPPTPAEKLSARKQFGFGDQDTVLLSVGTCNTKKDHFAIFDALEVLSNAGATPVKYLHRGHGPTLADEKEYARKKGINSRTTFVDFIDELRVVYWASDIFVMTSAYEGLGNVILEAMNCKLPVVLYNVLGMRDTIPDGMGGLLVEPSSRYLTSALEYLIHNPSVRLQMGEQAFASIRKHFSAQESLEGLLKLYAATDG